MTAPTLTPPQATPPMPAQVRRTLLNALDMLREDYGRTTDTEIARAWLIAQEKGEGK